MWRKHKVVVSVFCGRKMRTRILLGYLDRLVAAGIVDEVHLWDFCRDPRDRSWLDSLDADKKQYRVMRPKEVVVAAAATEGKKKLPPTFRNYYQYYWEQREQLAETNTILIKSDDDIVAVDTEHFTDFLDMRIDHPEYLLVLPNIVNNGVAAYYQQHLHQAIPPKLMDLEMPWNGICGRLWESGDLCERLHRYFISDPGRFSYAGCDVIEPHVRVSINFFAVLPEHVDLVFGAAAEAGDDERCLSVDSCLEHVRYKAICCRMYVSHLTFFMQEKHMTPAQIGGLLDLYDDLLQSSGGSDYELRRGTTPPEKDDAEGCSSSSSSGESTSSDCETSESSECETTSVSDCETSEESE